MINNNIYLYTINIVEYENNIILQYFITINMYLYNIYIYIFIYEPYMSKNHISGCAILSIFHSMFKSDVFMAHGHQVLLPLWIRTHMEHPGRTGPWRHM